MFTRHHARADTVPPGLQGSIKIPTEYESSAEGNVTEEVLQLVEELFALGEKGFILPTGIPAMLININDVNRGRPTLDAHVQQVPTHYRGPTDRVFITVPLINQCEASLKSIFSSGMDSVISG